MNSDLLKKIKSDFAESEYDTVISELETIKLKDVMANSQTNLNNTYSAILHLSKGDLKKLRELVATAKTDIRDVIYWETLDKE